MVKQSYIVNILETSPQGRSKGMAYLITTLIPGFLHFGRSNGGGFGFNPSRN